jgi:mercuric ion transport protein
MPLFAAIALVANALGWLNHRQWHRSVLGMIGPTLVLGALGWLGGEGWPVSLLYAGLGLMLAVSVWDLLWPTNHRCAPDGCELPAARN